MNNYLTLSLLLVLGGWHTIYGGIDASGKPYCYIKKFFFFKKYIELPQEPVFMGINVIKAACSQCQKEIVVFDSRYHGYDSQFTTEEQKEYILSFENSKAEVGNIILNKTTNKSRNRVYEYTDYLNILRKET